MKDAQLGRSPQQRNALRRMLWLDSAMAHQWLCHDGKVCKDGCSEPADDARLAFYRSEEETT